MKKVLFIILGVICFISIQGYIVQADGGFLIGDWVNGINLPRTDNPTESDEAIHIVIKVINRILSLTSVIAIIMFLIGGFKVLTANGDDTKVKGGYKVLKNATIGLLIIGLSWAIVRLIFRFIGGMNGDHTFDENSGP